MMSFVSKERWVNTVGQLGNSGNQLRGYLHVVPVYGVEGADPEPGAQLDQGVLPLAQRPNQAGHKGALRGPAVQLR